MLTKFWGLTQEYQRFVTYNGRGFDWPFLIIRSGINRVKVPMEIDHYNKHKFIDLADHLRQGGRQFKLEAFCRAFGITNPKEKGVSGLLVSQLYYEKIIKPSLTMFPATLSPPKNSTISGINISPVI